MLAALLLDNALKTASKKAIQNTAKTTRDLVSKKINW